MFHEAVSHRDPHDENLFMLYEMWEDLDDVVNVPLGRPYRQEWHAALPEVPAEPRDISAWHPLRTDRKRSDGERKTCQPTGSP
jgi:quinol monooxygenase YgiN